MNTDDENEMGMRESALHKERPVERSSSVSSTGEVAVQINHNQFQPLAHTTAASLGRRFGQHAVGCASEEGRVAPESAL